MGDLPWKDEFWSVLLVADSTATSQYDQLRRYWSAGGPLPGPVACLALAGKGFHGQHGRSWQTVRGNLHLSIALVDSLPARRYAASLPMLPAVAVVDALGDLGVGPPSLGIKWVNDILVNGHKVAGVLTSTRTIDQRVAQTYLGIGLNVAAAPALPMDGLNRPAQCLGQVLPGPAPGLGRVVATVLTHVQHRWQELVDNGPESLCSAYCEASLVLGRDVEIWPENAVADDQGQLPPPEIRGRVVDIDPDLGLRLENVENRIYRGRLQIVANKQ